MQKTFEVIKKVFLAAYLLVIHVLAFFFVVEQYIKPYPESSQTEIVQVNEPTEKTPVPIPQSIPSVEPTIDPFLTGDFNQNNTALGNQNNAPFQNQSNQANNAPNALMIPVVGIKREQLRDTYNDARSENRVHNAIDIMAAGGTPVVAAADGEIAKFFDSERGGITIYQYSSDRKFAYYYAHLQKRADNLKEKDFVKRGTIIGYVGDTGNSGAGNYHLHFTVTTLADQQRYWEGTDINPYSLLKDAVESQ